MDTSSDKKISYEKIQTWLRKGNFLSFLIGAQNHVIKTNYVKMKIDKTQKNSKCKLCVDREEAINHITNESSKIKQKEYKT